MSREYRPYPRCLYRGVGVSKIIHNVEEETAALADGWTRKEADWFDAPAAVTPVVEAVPVAPVRRGRKPRAD